MLGAIPSEIPFFYFRQTAPPIVVFQNKCIVWKSNFISRSTGFPGPPPLEPNPLHAIDYYQCRGNRLRRAEIFIQFYFLKSKEGKDNLLSVYADISRVTITFHNLVISFTLCPSSYHLSYPLLNPHYLMAAWRKEQTVSRGLCQRKRSYNLLNLRADILDIFEPTKPAAEQVCLNEAVINSAQATVIALLTCACL